MLIVALSLCLDELAHSFRSMQQPSASSSTDEGMLNTVSALAGLVSLFQESRSLFLMHC